MRFIGVLQFDTIATFEEFQKIISGLLQNDEFVLEIRKNPKAEHVNPSYAGWQLIILAKEPKEGEPVS